MGERQEARGIAVFADIVAGIIADFVAGLLVGILASALVGVLAADDARSFAGLVGGVGGVGGVVTCGSDGEHGCVLA
ncbi:MAG: hypothetical protein ACXWQ8_16665 [Ktedonobacterales bacterium]